MKEGTGTPSFYGLLKIHKDFDFFQPLRPICSGFNSCTVKISKFVYVFLKPAAQQNPSYIRDTSHFVHKIENDVAQKTTPNKTFLVTMNVFPNLKGVFPEPPILSYRRNQNLHNLIVRSSINRPPPCQTASNSSPYQKSRCKLCRSMSKSNSILNTQSGEQCTTTNTIYAVECTQHKLIFVGQSSQKLNMRFNGHRSDVNVKPQGS